MNRRRSRGPRQYRAAPWISLALLAMTVISAYARVGITLSDSMGNVLIHVCLFDGHFESVGPRGRGNRVANIGTWSTSAPEGVYWLSRADYERHFLRGSGRYRTVSSYPVVATLGASLLISLAFVPASLCRPPARRGMCPECGYARAGLPGNASQCPECGAKPPDAVEKP